jgi:hypothetical protein
MPNFFGDPDDSQALYTERPQSLRGFREGPVVTRGFEPTEYISDVIIEGEDAADSNGFLEDGTESEQK